MNKTKTDGHLRSLLALLAGCLLASCQQGVDKPLALKSRFFDHVEVIGERGGGVGQFNKPRGVALDRADNLFVEDTTGRVQKFGPDGRFLSSWLMPQTDIGKPKGMCRDEKGDIVILEPHYSRLNIYSVEGRLLVQWGAKGTNAGQLAFPRSVAVTGAGELYMTEYGPAERVQKFSTDGRKFFGAFGRAGSGPAEFNRAEGIDVDRNGKLHVADSCNHRVQILSGEGVFLSMFGKAGNGLGELSYPYDVRVDAAGYQFVCEFGNSRVQIFDEANRPVEILGGPGAEPGQMSNPWAIAFDSHGNLFVADGGNNRVLKFVRKKEWATVTSSKEAKP